VSRRPWSCSPANVAAVGPHWPASDQQRLVSKGHQPKANAQLDSPSLPVAARQATAGKALLPVIAVRTTSIDDPLDADEAGRPVGAGGLQELHHAVALDVAAEALLDVNSAQDRTSAGCS
jgi:hypothetical protein